MPTGLSAILRLEVPVAVRLGHCRPTIDRFLALGPGDLLELGHRANRELEVLAGDRLVAMGRAVRVGDRFGVRITRRVEGFQSDEVTA